MALKDGIRDLFDKAENNAARWLLVAVGVILLVRLRLVLFAAALPLMAYWHFSNQTEAGTSEHDAGDGAEDQDDDGTWPAEDADFDGDGDNVIGGRPFGAGGFDADADDRDLSLDREDGDPYDQSFWGNSQPAEEPKRTAPWRNNPRQVPAKGGADADGGPRLNGDDDFSDILGVEPTASRGPGAQKEDTLRRPAASWDEDPLMPGDGFDFDLPGSGGARGRGGGSRGGGGGFGGGGVGGGGDDLDDLGFSSLRKELGGGGTGLDDFDFLGGGVGDDMDFLGGSFGGGGGRGKGKGKGKSKSGDKGGKGDPMAPREPNPKQVFVANVGDMSEDDIRTFFEDVGEVDRVKVLRNPEGSSKGVCFVTFRTEDQAQKALTLHGQSLEGRNLVVRLAHGGNKGDKGGGKGGGSDRLGAGASEGPLDLGGSERFGAAFGDRGDRDRDRGDRGGGKGGRSGKGQGGARRNERNELDDLLEEALADGDGPLKAGDFDFAARRFLSELRSRDRSDGTARFREALDMVLKYTSSKDRSSVRKWPAYVFTLLQKFDTTLWEELRERDAERRREKGGGGFGGGKDRRPPDNEARRSPLDDD